MVTATGRIPAKHAPMHSPGVVGGATFTIGPSHASLVNIGIQLNDHRGTAIAERAIVYGYLATTATGDVASTVPDGGVIIGTDGFAQVIVAGLAWMLTSESDGDIDLDLTHTGGADTYFLIIVLPDGSLVASTVITIT